MKNTHKSIDELIHQHALPSTYNNIVTKYLIPLTASMEKLMLNRESLQPWLVGVQGTQGSGKSTICLFLKALLESRYDLNVVILSIDDFYKTRIERQALAQSIHVLFQTRGVPGTHDLELAQRTIEILSDLKQGDTCHVPVFDKSIDDRLPRSKWKEIKGKVDIILFEGWCVGIQEESEKSLSKPINALEEIKDKEGIWRNYVNDKLATEYRNLYQQIENYIVLQAPSFDMVYEWRQLQEDKLRLKAVKGMDSKVQSPNQIQVFISHFERLTQHALRVMPNRSTWLLKLDNRHQVTHLTCRGSDVI